MEENFDIEFKIKKSVESEKYKHLTEGHKPIHPILGLNSYKERLVLLADFNKNSSEALNLNFEENQPDTLDKENILHNGFRSYTLSPLDKRDKYDEGLYHCVGFVIAGINENGEEVSIFNHIRPVSFLTDQQKESFIKDLENKLDEVNQYCKKGSIDAMIFGGNYSKQLNSNRISFKKDYLDTVELLKELLQEKLKFEPRIENGPSPITTGPDSAFYKTNERELILLRGKINENIDDFPVSDILEEK